MMVMKRLLKRGMLVVALSTVLATAVDAHHSHASLNRDDVRLYSGVVTRYSWTMPHVFLKIDAPDPDGNVVEYTVEMLHPPAMRRRGWAKDTFAPGDRITWQGPHDRDLDRHYTGLRWAEKADGQRFAMEQSEEGEATPSTDFTGLWKRSDVGGFNPHYRPPEGWPFNETGQAMVAGFDENNNPAVTCVHPGPPKAMLLPYPMQITRPDAKTVVIERELLPELRVIHLDDAPPPGEPSFLGHSTGAFQGDELVVETSNFTADKWGTHTGVDSSEQKHLVERFSLSEDGMYLTAEITVTDPVYFTEPVTFSHRWVKIADRDVIQAPCTMEAAQLYLEAGYTSDPE